MAPQPEKQPKTFDQLMGKLSKVKQYPIDLQPINPMPPTQKPSENEKSSETLTGNDWDDSTARSLVRDGLAKDLDEAIQMVKEDL